MAVQIRVHDSAAGTAHSNSTDEASLARKLFAANELVPGKVYLIKGAARATATNSTDTATMRLRFGTSSTVTSNTAVGVSQAVDVADNDVAIVDAILTVHSKTRAVLHGFISDCDASNSQALVSHFVSILTIAADTAYYLDFTADWSAASASDSIQSEAWDVIEVA